VPPGRLGSRIAEPGVLPPRADHEDDARAVARTDDDVLGVRVVDCAAPPRASNVTRNPERERLRAKSGESPISCAVDP